MQLVFGENVLRKTNKNILILTPLAVAPQTIREGEKFGIEVKRSRNGKVHRGINVTNYQQLTKYNPADFVCVIADESSAIKHSDAKTRKLVTDFMRNIPYRLLCTATPAPNDFMELGCSAEALGMMTRNSMLGMFFTNDGETTQQWRLKGHARKRFWQWVSTWARAVRKPSDLGYPDDDFILPPLKVTNHVVKSKAKSGFFPRLAQGLAEQRAEKKESLVARCEKVAEIMPTDRPCFCWCQLNSEGDLLTELLPDAVQVAGKDSDEYKEEMLNAFALGQIRVMVSKASLAGFGLNLQNCADTAYFPTHSGEAYYQCIRRFWRFGQKREVNCHLVYSEAEGAVASNLLRKERMSAAMFDGILQHMNQVVKDNRQEENGDVEIKLPNWLKNGAR